MVEGDGKLVTGRFRPEANASPLGSDYAAHTRGCNSDAIGFAFCGMFGARERPFMTGDFPLRWEQVRAGCWYVRQLCERYDIPITRETVLTHAEVEKTLGVRQRGKWDITWLPGMVEPGAAVWIGDQLRDMIEDASTEIFPSAKPARTAEGLRKAIIGAIDSYMTEGTEK
jgi:hypothetical protein